MAVNPDGTPGHVAAGELVESAWGNSVSDTIAHLVSRFAVPNVMPAGIVDAGNASLSDWLLTSLTVPTWARGAIVNYYLDGFFEPTGMGGGPIYLAGRLGIRNGFQHSISGQGENVRMSLAWADAFTGVPTGTQTIGVQVGRPGSKTLRADGETKLIMTVNYSP